MRQVVAFTLVPKSGLPSAESKAGMVVEVALKNDRFSSWSYVETQDGETWAEVTDEGLLEDCWDIQHQIRINCQSEGRCAPISVEDYDEGTYRVQMMLIEGNTVVAPGAPGSGPVPPNVGADLPTRVGTFLRNPLVLAGIAGGAAVLGYLIFRRK